MIEPTSLQRSRSRRARRGLSRRQFIPRAVGSLAVAFGVGGVDRLRTARPRQEQCARARAHRLDRDNDPDCRQPRQRRRRASSSRPDLRPALVTITERTHHERIDDSPRFVVMAPMADVPYKGVQRGPMLLDRRGRMVWYQPGAGLDLRRPDPALQGQAGADALARAARRRPRGRRRARSSTRAYTTVATVGDAQTVPIDLHEFNLTSRGTALATQYETRDADLSSIGGSKNGKLLVGHALEIDIATNKVLLDWVSMRSRRPERELPTAARLGRDRLRLLPHQLDRGGAGRQPADLWAQHLGCVQGPPHDRRDHLAAERQEVRLQRPSERGLLLAAPRARLTGLRRSPCSTTPTSAATASVALLLELDEGRRQRRAQARVISTPPSSWPGRSAASRCSPTAMSSSAGARSRTSPSSRPTANCWSTASSTARTRSYRTFLADWEGRPTDKPAMVARANAPAAASSIYASWNGATEIDHWLVLAGSDPASLRAGRLAAVDRL